MFENSNARSIWNEEGESNRRNENLKKLES